MRASCVVLFGFVLPLLSNCAPFHIIDLNGKGLPRDNTAASANGFYRAFWYATDAPLIIAHVQETQTLVDKGGNTVATLELDYWEWFSTVQVDANLHAQLGALPSAQDAAAIQGEVDIGDRLFATDAIQSFPYHIASHVLPVADPDVRNSFGVEIERTHTYYAGGDLANQGAGDKKDLGWFGMLAKDANGIGPSLTLDFADPTLADNNALPLGKIGAGRGSITTLGDDVGTLVLVHKSSWSEEQKPVETPPVYFSALYTFIDIDGIDPVIPTHETPPPLKMKTGPK